MVDALGYIWLIAPELPQSIVDKAMDRDPAAAAAEYMAQFRTDVESFIAREAVEDCVNLGIRERPSERKHGYVAFVDPSGGSSDAMTLAIAHKEGETEVLDLIRERKPPFSPEAVAEEFARVIREYRCTTVYGDRYGGEWPREQFRKHGVNYEPSEKNKSELYRDLLPLLNSGAVDLLEHDRLVTQLTSLERRTARGGRDSIDHAPGAHDDVANAVAGALVTAYKEPGVANFRRRYPLSEIFGGLMTFSPERDLVKYPRFIAQYDDGSDDVFAVPHVTLEQGRALRALSDSSLASGRGTVT